MKECASRGGVWWISGGRLILVDARRRARWLPIIAFPHEEVLRKAFGEMIGVAGNLGCRPRLVFVESLAGSGGIYADGLIAVGLQDARQILEQVWAGNPATLIGRIRAVTGDAAMSIRQAANFLFVAVVARIIAHELGHAMRAQLGVRTPFSDEEAAADFIAGVLDGARGRDREIGRRIFRAIGCEALTCTHPTPYERAWAYVAGHEYASETA